jgi:hypothetical protein
MDVADASIMGQHALAYVLLAFAGCGLSRRILWFPLLLQATQGSRREATRRWQTHRAAAMAPRETRRANRPFESEAHPMRR